MVDRHLELLPPCPAVPAAGQALPRDGALRAGFFVGCDVFNIQGGRVYV